MLVPLPGVQALAGLEVIAAGIAGHLPGVLLGGALFASKTGAVTDNLPTSLLPSINAASGPLTVWAALALLVRVVTFSQDSRYLTFPSDVRHPMGCTRLTTDRPSRTGSLQVPVLNAEPSFVQHEASEWLKSQSFTTIKVEEEGYIYVLSNILTALLTQLVPPAEQLSTLFGFPDSIGVKVFTNSKKQSEVWVQSELRVGEGDLGVNQKRVEKLVAHLTKTCN